MRILYVASDQEVPGHTGGSVHTLEVARGLSARGHEVHAVVHRPEGASEVTSEFGVTWHRIRFWPDHRLFRLRARPLVSEIASKLAPDAVIERYYNFGGEGIQVAEARRIPSVLEVNSPVVDHKGSLKGLIDRALLFRPLQKWRETLCRKASALIAPLPEIVPPFARAKTEIVTWGANVDEFHPKRRSKAARTAMGAPERALVVLFIGSFRPWHGVHVLENAARLLSGRAELFFVLVGGPTRGDGKGYAGRQLGALPYDSMPEVVASADIGVAPYDPRRLSQLSLGFYWSPLKIFEYMASGLPTLTIARPPLTEIVREGQEGLHFREGDGGDLALVLEGLAARGALREQMGLSARRRVVELYSWERHCEQIERVLLRLVA